MKFPGIFRGTTVTKNKYLLIRHIRERDKNSRAVATHPEPEVRVTWPLSRESQQNRLISKATFRKKRRRQNRTQYSSAVAFNSKTGERALRFIRPACASEKADAKRTAIMEPRTANPSSSVAFTPEKQEEEAQEKAKRDGPVIRHVEKKSKFVTPLFHAGLEGTRYIMELE